MNYFDPRPAAGRTVFDPRTASQPQPTPPSMPDIARLVAEGLLKPIFDGLSTAAKNLSESMSSGTSASRSPSSVSAPTGQPTYVHGTHKYHDCGCGCGCHGEKWPCRSDPCHCKCCIVNADLIVYVRLGETRIVPLEVENHWKRERKITAELSTWTTRGGSPAPVTGRLLPPAPEFTLPPCGHQTITLVIEIRGTGNEDRTADVDNCTVAYADLIVRGCDVRPIRIAVAILPRDCEAYEIDCDCHCCC